MKNQKTRVVFSALGILILAVAMMGARCTRRVTGQVSCPVGQRCTVTVGGQIEWLTGNNLQGESDDIANRAYILDLAEPWQPDSSLTPQATINIRTDSGIVSETFSLSLAPEIAQTIESVDKDTIPHVFVFENSASVQSFLNTAAAGSSSSQPETTADVTFAITQTDCTAPSGKYVNHARYRDGTEITYVDTVYINYTAPTNIQAGCNQGQITILE